MFSKTRFHALALGAALFMAIQPIRAEPPAQPGGDDKPAGERERPRRESRSMGMRAGMAAMDPAAIDKLYETVGFDAQQKAEAQKFVEASRTKFAEKMQAARPSPEEQEKMRAMRDEVRAAREAGDQEKMRELTDQMRKMFAARNEAMETYQRELHDGLKAIARPDQAEKFESAWTEMSSRGPGRGMMRERSLRAFERAVMSLDLTADQKSKIEPLIQDFMKEQRGRGGERQQPGDERVAMNDLKKKIEEHLTDEQKQKLEQRLSDEGRRGERRRGPRRGEGGPDMPPPGGDE